MSHLTKAALSLLVSGGLAGCEGVREASEFAKKSDYEAGFQQIALVGEDVARDRTLVMYVVTKRGRNGVSAGYSVPFSAAAATR